MLELDESGKLVGAPAESWEATKPDGSARVFKLKRAFSSTMGKS
ncbi:hypothetical protein N8D56_16635 [Devosia sp. A8/3-2]|nr:hypothetical protein N8D56_16635 [Devosia sp. A8/3-2]